MIGPLVICGFLVNKKDEKKLEELGVKDSKLLTPRKREELAPQLEKIASHIVIISCLLYTSPSPRDRG